jgi:hypothetical protein
MIRAKTSEGLSSHERISKLASRLFVLGWAPTIIRWPAQRPPTPPSLTTAGGPARSGRGAPTRPRQRSGSLFSSEPRRLSVLSIQGAIIAICPAASRRAPQASPHLVQQSQIGATMASLIRSLAGCRHARPPLRANSASRRHHRRDLGRHRHPDFLSRRLAVASQPCPAAS